VPRKPGRPKAKPTTPPPAQKAIHKEAKCLIMVAVGILLLLSVFVPSAIGFVGAFFEGLLFGLFGFGAFVLPIALIAIAIMLLINRQLRLPVALTITLFVLILAMFHILNTSDLSYLGFFARLRDVFLEGSRFAGGFFGALVGEILYLFLDSIGSIVALSAAIVIVTVLLTGKSFVSLVAKGAEAVGSAASKAKEHYINRPKVYEEYDDYDDYDEEISLQARKKPMHDIEIDLFDLEDDEFGEEDSPHVSLFQEDMKSKSEKTTQKPEPIIGTGPLFASRSVNKKPSEAVLFLDQDEYDFAGETHEDYFQDDAPVVKGLIEESIEIEEYEQESIPPPEPTRQASKPKPRVVNFPANPTDPPEPIIRSRQPQGQPTISYASTPSYDDFELPPIDILNEPPQHRSMAESRTQILENSRILEDTLRSFRIEAKVVEVSVGPTVTRYDLAPGPGVKVSSIANLSNDLALSLAAQGIRIEAPIPGKSAVGIEIPNKEPQPVFLREILQEQSFTNFPSKLAFAVGKDIAGEPMVTDIARMPHLLIAGATGSGKSVCINTLIASLLFKSRPDEVKLLMIDPKVVELSVYNGIPHLLIPVVTDPKKASGALSWAVSEMESRYNMFAETGCRDLKGFNKVKEKQEEPELPQIVIIIDELADLMMACKGEVEESICRLAQKARAAGIHLIVATQRPSVDVITGLIKANIPSRLAFAVSSGTDSRTVLDMYGAEKLLGKGDMLFLPMGNNKPVRIQGGFISDQEVESLVSFLKAQAPAEYTTEMIQQVTMPGKTNIEGNVDEFFHDAVDFLLTKGKASTSMLQRQFRIGYNRASRLMDELETRGIVGPEDGVKPRKITITREEYQEIYNQ